MDFNKLAQEINQINQEKGFNDSNNSPLETICKIHSEIGEATQQVMYASDPIWFGEDGKPEGEYVEICDASIRTLGYLAYREFDFYKPSYSKLRFKNRYKNHNYLHLCLTTATDIYREQGDGKHLLEELFGFVCLCRDYLNFKYPDIDFEATMRLKIEYNKTRPYLHGNKEA